MDWFSLLPVCPTLYVVCALLFSSGSNAIGNVLIPKILQSTSQQNSLLGNRGILAPYRSTRHETHNGRDDLPFHKLSRVQYQNPDPRTSDNRVKRDAPVENVPPSLDDDSVQTTESSNAITSVQTIQPTNETTKQQMTSDTSTDQKTESNDKTLHITTVQTVTKGEEESTTQNPRLITTDNSYKGTHTPRMTTQSQATADIIDKGANKDGALSTTTSSCDGQMEATLTNFGNYGLIAFAGALGLAGMLLFIIFLFVCLPRCVNKKRGKRKKRHTIENVSDMRTPAVVYRPRPSLKATTTCVPTPLAMIINEEPTLTSVSSRKDSDSGSKVPTTDLDDTLDPLAPEDTRDDRKMSNMSV